MEVIRGFRCCGYGQSQIENERPFALNADKQTTREATGLNKPPLRMSSAWADASSIEKRWIKVKGYGDEYQDSTRQSPPKKKDRQPPCATTDGYHVRPVDRNIEIKAEPGGTVM